jgi:hypothetical protein
MMDRPWGDIVEMLEWRSQRLERQEQEQPNNTQYQSADRVIQTNDLSALGIKDVSKDGG